MMTIEQSQQLIRDHLHTFLHGDATASHAAYHALVDPIDNDLAYAAIGGSLALIIGAAARREAGFLHLLLGSAFAANIPEGAPAYRTLSLQISAAAANLQHGTVMSLLATVTTAMNGPEDPDVVAYARDVITDLSGMARQMHAPQCMPDRECDAELFARGFVR